jgi:hypothetical protein
LRYPIRAVPNSFWSSDKPITAGLKSHVLEFVQIIDEAAVVNAAQIMEVPQ